MSEVFTGGVGGGGVWVETVGIFSTISFAICTLSGNNANSGDGELCAVV